MKIKYQIITKHLENKYPDAFVFEKIYRYLQDYFCGNRQKRIKMVEENKMVVSKFTINGTDYVVVKLENSAHIMIEKEWRRAYGSLHPERWKK